MYVVKLPSHAIDLSNPARFADLLNFAPSAASTARVLAGAASIPIRIAHRRQRCAQSGTALAQWWGAALNAHHGRAPLGLPPRGLERGRRVRLLSCFKGLRGFDTAPFTRGLCGRAQARGAQDDGATQSSREKVQAARAQTPGRRGVKAPCRHRGVHAQSFGTAGAGRARRPDERDVRAKRPVGARDSSRPRDRAHSEMCECGRAARAPIRNQCQEGCPDAGRKEKGVPGGQPEGRVGGCCGFGGGRAGRFTRKLRRHREGH